MVGPLAEMVGAGGADGSVNDWFNTLELQVPFEKEIVYPPAGNPLMVYGKETEPEAPFAGPVQLTMPVPEPVI